MGPQMKWVHFLVLAAPLTMCCCGSDVSAPRKDKAGYFYSFEDGMQGWGARGLDLELGDDFIEWSIRPTDEKAKDGSTGLELYLENWNDAGKIWIERAFQVKSKRRYRLELKYWFCTADFGLANLWTIISGVVPDSPETRDDLVYDGHTGNGAESDVGYRWIEKSFNLIAEPDSDGTLYVLIGVWGTWETPRRYYLDSVSIVLTQI